MNQDFQCPLTEGQITLLRTAVERFTGKERALACALTKSPSTVHTDFARIYGTLGVHDRVGAILIAIACGWVAGPHLAAS